MGGVSPLLLYTKGSKLIKVFINGKENLLEPPISILELKNKIRPDADLVILNGFPVSDDIYVSDNDHIFFIKKGEIPLKDEIEYLLVSRHTPGVFERLKKSSVVVAGVGGLGSNIVISLARMGVGRIRFIDFDIVDPSNINRQHYFIDQIGQKKVFALFETVKRINPYLVYEPIDAYLDEKNMPELLTGADIVLEAFDRAEEKAKITRYMLGYQKDTFFIAASGLAGYGDTEKIKITRVKEKFFIVGDMESEAKPGMGLMAPRVAVAGNIQANLAIRILLGDI